MSERTHDALPPKVDAYRMNESLAKLLFLATTFYVAHNVVVANVLASLMSMLNTLEDIFASLWHAFSICYAYFRFRSDGDRQP